ncbi:MAG: RAMP superfamily CRISPR-associated protein, partial [Myxococcota bacterium]
MRKAANFDILKKRLRLTGVITTVSGLHIGAGAGEIGSSDLPVLRDALGYPIIPGSSIKGVLRSTIEGLVRSIQRGRWWACNPLGKATAEGP